MATYQREAGLPQGRTDTAVPFTSPHQAALPMGPRDASGEERMRHMAQMVSGDHGRDVDQKKKKKSRL